MINYFYLGLTIFIVWTAIKLLALTFKGVKALLILRSAFGRPRKMAKKSKSLHRHRNENPELKRKAVKLDLKDIVTQVESVPMPEVKKR